MKYLKYRIIKKKTKTSWGWGFDGPTMDIYHIQGIPDNFICNFIMNRSYLYNLLQGLCWKSICCEDVNCHTRINGTGYFEEFEQVL